MASFSDFDRYKQSSQISVWKFIAKLTSTWLESFVQSEIQLQTK